MELRPPALQGRFLTTGKTTREESHSFHLGGSFKQVEMPSRPSCREPYGKAEGEAVIGASLAGSVPGVGLG